MLKNKQIKHKGFTLLEILLVTGIIGILTAIVIIAINPGRSLAKARDVQRKVGITEINKGLEQYYIDNNRYPTSINGSIGSLQSICVTGDSATSTGFDCGTSVDLSMLVPTYLPSIPADPTGVGYKVGFNSSRRIMLVADLTETVSPLIAIGTTTYPVVAVVEDTNPNIYIGDGSVGSPYQINNWSQLNHIRDSGYMSKYYILMSSLTSATYGYAGLGSAWTPIGSSGTPFTGNFNGNNNTISNLVINKPTTAEDVGLFSHLSGSGQISNLGLINVNITGKNWVGAFAGGFSGTISNSYSTGNVTGSGYVGGLVGEQSGGDISNSYSTVDVVGGGDVGGFVGRQSGGSITYSHSIGNVNGGNRVGGFVGFQYDSMAEISNSYSTGNVSCSGDKVGGFIGDSWGYDGGDFYMIEDSYSTGNVSGVNSVGGFIGNLMSGYMKNSYSTGLVSGSGSGVGGFAGTKWSGGSGFYNEIYSSFWDQTTSLRPTSAGGVGVIGTTTAGMKTASLYTGWSDSIWNIADGSYPTLK
jgi:prepilin-type N-terminal cleavage/methylation domain-containing protein